MCCGAGGLLKANSPRAADKIALLRLKQSRAKNNNNVPALLL